MSTGSVPFVCRHFGTDLLGILHSSEALVVGAAFGPGAMPPKRSAFPDCAVPCCQRHGRVDAGICLPGHAGFYCAFHYHELFNPALYADMVRSLGCRSALGDMPPDVSSIVMSFVEGDGLTDHCRCGCCLWEWFDLRWVCPVEHYGHFEWVSAMHRTCLMMGFHWANLPASKKKMVTLRCCWMLGSRL